MRFSLLFLLFLVTGCANTDFPFCCDQTGLKDVPYTTTYDMTISTGFSNIGGNLSILRIISQGDIDNLFNAANVSKVPGTGVVGGFVLSLNGDIPESVVLSATDADGNPVGDLFYNSLGGVPDFSTTSGTSASGGFTLLNAPPGEIYFKAIEGGRGNGQAISYADSAFLTNISVVPVVPPYIGVTGAVKEYDSETSVLSALITPVGLKGLSVVVNSGSYRFPRLGSDSTFLVETTQSGYYDTYTTFKTDLASRPQGAIDVTQNLFLFPNSLLAQVLSQTHYGTQTIGNGILVGGARDTDDTFRINPKIKLTNNQGTDLTFNGPKSRIYFHGSYPNPDLTDVLNPALLTYFYFDQSGDVLYYDIFGVLHSYNNTSGKTCANNSNNCPPSDFGTLDGKYIALDLPPGKINLSATTIDQTNAGYDLLAGTESAGILADSVTLQDVTMNKMGLGKTDHYLDFVGSVTRSDGVTPVGFATIFALGNLSSLTTVDGMGNFYIPESSFEFLDQASYTLKVGNPPSYLDTYQEEKVDQTYHYLTIYPLTVLNLYLSVAGLSTSLDTTKGILTGLILDNLSGRGTDGITLQATDLAGNIVGDIRYFDSAGLPTRTSSSSRNGGYIIFNLPPGLVQIRAVSQDDSGNILAYAYANGVTLSDLHVNNGPLPSVQISGSTTDLNGAPESQVSLSILGEKVQFSSDGSGLFSYPFAPYSQFTVKARTPLSGGMNTYNLFQTDTSDLSGLNLKAITSVALVNEAANAGLVPDYTSLGVIGGKVTTSGFSSAVTLPGITFSAMSTITNAPHKLSAGLFNQDNEPDLALVNWIDSTLTVFLGGGDGTFRMSTGSPLCLPDGKTLVPGQSCSFAAEPVAVRVRDIDGDGIPDLIVANYGLDSISILLGTREGNFHLAPSVLPNFRNPIPLPAGSRPVDISVGDFNNDGFLDLAVANSGNNTYSVILGQGNGLFSSQVFNFSSGGSSPSAILNADFNGDGNLDLAIVNKIGPNASTSGAVSVFFGYGTGAFAQSPASPIFVGNVPVGIVSTDLNGDGFPDLVVINNGSSSISVMLGKGGGLFSKDLCQTAPIPSFCTLAGAPEAVSIQDINFDGRNDLITSSSLNSGEISVLTGVGDGTFSKEVRYALPGNPTNLVFADFNNDTFLDAVALQSATGTLAFLPGIEVPVPQVKIEAADLDGNSVGQVRYYQNGTLMPSTTNTMTDTSGRFLILNLPPGLKNIHATEGASGNRFMTSYKASGTFGTISVIPPDFSMVQYSGKTVDPVGDQIFRNVEGVNIFGLGTGNFLASDQGTGAFAFNNNGNKFDANSFLFFKLQK